MTTEIQTADAVSREHAINVARHFGWNISKASMALAVDRRTLYRQLERWGVDVGAERRAHRPAPTPSPVDFYDCDDGAEELFHSDLGAAIGAFLDGADFDCLGEEIVAYAWVRDPVSSNTSKNVAEVALEQARDYLDDNYGSTEEPSDITAAMETAAAAFAAVVVAEYSVWRCSRSKRHDVTVNVAQWVLDNEPQWIAERPDVGAYFARGGKEKASAE